MKSGGADGRVDVTGLILFGHGARDPRWREPFERLLVSVQSRHPGPVSLAFLDHMPPDLVQACRELVSKGAGSIVVVPIFFGTGGHVRQDLPNLADSVMREVGVAVTLAGPAGEDERVLTSIVEYAVSAALPSSPGSDQVG